ncbi:TPA: DUF551 domain-containing protein [Pseudomonas aeruginosa]|nr:DUF551 domain-containing protein [Pseudomonas aeruginosa]
MSAWISVNDRLPTVVCTNVDGVENVNFVLVRYREAPVCGSEFQTANAVWVNGMGKDQISHWMEIPEIPA